MDSELWMTGRVGSDVELRDSNPASQWVTFRLACTPRSIRAGGEWGDEQTTWVTVSCNRRLAEHVKLSLRKGDPVVVVGKLRTRRWHDSNGIEHEQLQIKARSVGHDLAIGTTSFYRPRRDPVPEPEASEQTPASPASADEELTVPDFFPEAGVEVEEDEGDAEELEVAAKAGVSRG